MKQTVKGVVEMKGDEGKVIEEVAEGNEGEGEEAVLKQEVM